MHALSDPGRLLELARSLARTGTYRDWAAVHARLVQLGFVDVEAVANAQFIVEINQICARCNEGRDHGDESSH
jgi:hypothetical protein